MQMTFLRGWAPHILSILRILAAATFLTHGTMKLFGWPAPFEFPMSGLSYTAAILEVVGGLLLIVGLFSRPVAFILSGMMAVAYWQFHAPGDVYPLNNGGELAIMYCFAFFYFIFAGPGPWSLDAMMSKRA